MTGRRCCLRLLGRHKGINDGRVRIYDADGVEITRCVRAELHTGKVTRYQTGLDGMPILNEERDAALIEHIGCKAPLRYELVENSDAPIT